jgi:hypothetical protein
MHLVAQIRQNKWQNSQNRIWTVYCDHKLCVKRQNKTQHLVEDTYLCNRCTYPLMLWVRIPLMARCTILCDKGCQWLVAGRWFSPGTPVSSTNKTDREDITEILLKVPLNIIKNFYVFKFYLNYTRQRSGFLAYRDTTLCEKVCLWLATGQWFSPGTPVSSTNKTDRQDITEILLKVPLNIITLTHNVTVNVIVFVAWDCKICLL